MKLKGLRNILPSWKNALLAVLAAVLLILAFPDFEFWFLAWFALVPLLWSVERETERGRPRLEHGRPRPNERRFDAKKLFVLRTHYGRGRPCSSFVLGWLFGNVFFFGTCWWLTYAPITYAGFPPLLAYFLLFCVTSVAAIFPGIFAAILSILLQRFGTIAILAAPFVWVFTEFLRYWLTGNNWNAIGYSQAFSKAIPVFSAYGGVLLSSFMCLVPTVGVLMFFADQKRRCRESSVFLAVFAMLLVFLGAFYHLDLSKAFGDRRIVAESTVVAIQPNVSMSGLTQEKWNEYRRRHVALAESALAKLNERRTITNEPPTIDLRPPTTVVFPESPMNFMYEDDAETRLFINGFAAKNNVSVLFNSAEPNKADGKYFNSAVLVGPDGKEVAQYDKIYLLPFGESVPAPLQSIVPAFVGSFSYGSEYDLIPIGDAKAGVMICFESHFGQLSREYVRNGADVIIEMTNDGYLGPTPILRQHLANAVFRAVETNRPVLRVTNVGITAYINERGQVLDAAPPYQEDTRIWSVSKSDSSQTFYVRYGDWFAWLCSVVTIGLIIVSFRNRRPVNSN